MTGWSLAVFMFGLLVMQYYSYVTGELYRQDSRRNKTILHTVVALATVSPHRRSQTRLRCPLCPVTAC